MSNKYLKGAEHLRSLLDYDPETGEFSWKYRENAHKSWNTRFAGKPAGYITVIGYVRLCIEGKRYPAHRLSYLWMTGKEPPDLIDHINGNKADNRWLNLRSATKSENNRNAKLRQDNTSGVPGISWHNKVKKWQIMIGGQHLGRTEDFFEACCICLSERHKKGYSSRWR